MEEDGMDRKGKKKIGSKKRTQGGEIGREDEKERWKEER
jgi:hypothetical protein